MKVKFRFHIPNRIVIKNTKNGTESSLPPQYVNVKITIPDE